MTPPTNLTGAQLKWALERIDLAKASELALREMREDLQKQEREILMWPPTKMGEHEFKQEWKSTAQLTTADYRNLAGIKDKLQFLDHFAIKTQKQYQKLGHEIKTIIVAGDEVREL